MAIPYELFRIFAHRGPVILTLQKFEGLGTTGMASDGHLVMALQQMEAEGLVVRDVETIAGPEPSSLFSAFGKRDTTTLANTICKPKP
jgi:hypothetical protein